MTKGHPSRRRVLRASAVTAVGIGGITTGFAAGTSTEAGTNAESWDYRQVPCLDLSGVEFRTESDTAATPERSGGIRPGSLVVVHYPDGTTAGCTANFVWREVGGSDPSMYLGAAGHCFLPPDANASTNAKRAGEDEDDLYDVGQLEVEVCGRCTYGGAAGNFLIEGSVLELGEVAYARQTLPDGSQIGHDFGVIEIPSARADAVEASLPQWGGPTGVSHDAVPQGEPVHQYGAGVGNGEVYPTMGRTGVSQGDRGSSESWVATTRASPGDSGSPMVSSTALSDPTPEGEDAAGILTHLVASADPFGTGTAGTTIGRCMELASTDATLDLAVELA